MAMKWHLEAMGRRLRAVGEALGCDKKGLKGDGEML